MSAITTQAKTFVGDDVPADHAAEVVADAITAENRGPATRSDETPQCWCDSRGCYPTGSSTG